MAEPDRHTGCTHSLRTNTYECTPFSRLPLEIQEEVFSWSAVIDPPFSSMRRRKLHKPLRTPLDYDDLSDSDDELHGSLSLDERRKLESIEDSLGFIRISHVCKSWRAILLSMKRVWANNVGTLPLAATDMVLRARSCPVTITVQDTNLHGAFDINRMPEAPVIRVIHGTFLKPSRDDLRDYVSVISTRDKDGHPLEALNTLETVNLSVLGAVHRLDDIPYTVTPSLLSVTSKNLFIAFIARSLRHLSITFEDSESGRYALEMPRFLSTLRGCCGTLQELKLVHCFALDFQPWPEPVRFPALCRLDVGGCSSSLLDIIRDCFAYPSTCDVALHALEDHSVHDGRSDKAIYHALRIFSDEVTGRSGSYGFIFNILPGESPYISVRALAPENSTGKGDLFVEHPDLGFRRVYFDPEKTRRGVDVFEVLYYTLYLGDDGLDLSALRGARALSVVHTDPTKRHREGKRVVLLEMPELRVLHLHGFDKDTMWEVCGTEYDGKPFLPNIEVLRLSAGYPSAPPICLKLFSSSLWARAEHGQPKGEPCTLPCLVVNRDVEFDESLEKQDLEVESMKRERWVDKVVWKE
ncbi:hypothetical protein PENSPDRAFT_683158 [Peniophora sp. CONT]|nr:hypothetical protein PENSPDRAFT_683158 [Peniophora sp. CONT]